MSFLHPLVQREPGEYHAQDTPCPTACRCPQTAKQDPGCSRFWLRGIGARILPSGRRRYFLHNSQTDGRSVWQSIGDTHAMSLERGREGAASLPASRSRNDGVSSATGASLLFEDVAQEVFQRYGRHWRPRTLDVNLGCYRSRILPWFEGRAIGTVTRRDMQRWFASLHATPAAADRSAPVLSVILRQAEVYGYCPEGSNPCIGIKRYRRRSRERFLTDGEIRRLRSYEATRRPALKCRCCRLSTGEMGWMPPAPDAGGREV